MLTTAEKIKVIMKRNNINKYFLFYLYNKYK